MRLPLIQLLRCSRCGNGALSPDSPASRQLLFGPVRCGSCGTGFAVAEGVVDLGPDAVLAPESTARKAFGSMTVARTWERWLRPAVLSLGGGRSFDVRNEAALVRSLLGEPQGPVLDIGCGTGALLRALARRTDLPPLVGLDASRAMLEEAMSLSREEGVPVDLLRAEAPALPFRDEVLGGAVQSGSLAAMSSVAPLFAEVHRTLRPGARYVLLEWLPESLTRFQRRLGLHTRRPEELRMALGRAGFTRLEHIDVRPYRVFQAVRA